MIPVEYDMNDKSFKLSAFALYAQLFAIFISHVRCDRIVFRE